MKVVLFCGGLGMRLRDYSESIPKPMVNIGYRPILWHVMKYYAHFGHKDFILCLGYKADVIKNYFLNYNECISNDFVMSKGGKGLYLIKSDIDEWRITFVDTGMKANIGQRLMTVKKYLENEETFLANYSDGLTDFYLPNLIESVVTKQKIAGMLCVRPNQSYHIISTTEDGIVEDIQGVDWADIWINGGFFVFRKDIFKYIKFGEELVSEPFKRLMKDGELVAQKYEGFWISMETFKDKQRIDDMCYHGETPWQVWKSE